ncbi:response regulator transcription factor [Tunturiibacter empetritectus]|uniref:Response regulator transcription factor n=1 Tax=Tunturiibacter empetritectus TaxID=3069691 RepID=A0AAU7ZI13_9BACT
MRVLVVDDHPILRFGVIAIIQGCGDMTVVGQAGTAFDAVRLFEEHRPDVTLMDLSLPDGSGVDAIRKIRRSHPVARIIVLTTYEGDEDIYQALEAGAMGYLIKGMPHQSLIDALRRVHAGRRFLPAPVTTALSSRMPDGELSTREREVLALLVRGFSNYEIAEQLSIKESTVKCHVSVILQRLEVTDRTQAVVTALKRGLAHL